YTEEQRGVPGGFAGDPDVMDTWATSSMTPQIVSHWGIDEARHQKLFPMDIRPQSHEIIRTWAFYTIVKAWMHHNEIPWKHVVISGWILDPDRKKMSKSVGNVITPNHLLEEYSADGVRYWASRARLGADTAFDESVLKVGKRLCTKLFNASRFVIGQLDRVEFKELRVADITEPVDRALVSRLRKTIEDATRSFDKFDYAGALEATEKEFWAFCNDYLELVKRRSYEDEDTAGRRSAVATLALALRTFLRLFAPFVPFITEEIWSWRFADAGEPSIHKAAWPSLAESDQVEAGDANLYDCAIEVLSKIRSAKTEAKRSLRWPVVELVLIGPKTNHQAVEAALSDVIEAGAAGGSSVRYEEGEAPAGEKFEVRVVLGEEVASS
ncbi:MAG: class I tRNA ligase family protein, partial [Candidatus Eremiobacteraeota bacterium]|nr:class I tRNA ligase family protein [Candidatus Eremiobacteraeota bacterium]